LPTAKTPASSVTACAVVPKAKALAANKPATANFNLCVRIMLNSFVRVTDTCQKTPNGLIE
jgi:hypothetical protein